MLRVDLPREYLIHVILQRNPILTFNLLKINKSFRASKGVVYVAVIFSEKKKKRFMRYLPKRFPRHINPT